MTWLIIKIVRMNVGGKESDRGIHRHEEMIHFKFSDA